MPESNLYVLPKEPAHPQTPNNLRAQPTPLVGRDGEVEAICRLLSDRGKNVRLLTLVGPGGTGKTRLAAQVAEEMLADFEDGVYFVELAAITDPELVVPAITGALQVSAADADTPFTALQEHLQGKRVLLVLDNFEQVLPAARTLADLLATCADLTLLVTSRSVLRLRSEQEYVVPPLALPERGERHSASRLLQYGAVALFTARAAAVKPDFELTSGNAEAVVEVCRRVDALPLGIELVAAYARLLTPQATLARLTHPLHLLSGGAIDAPTRHQTMRDTIEWSYKLLTEDDQRLLRQMSAFVGNFSLQAVEAVCNKAGDLTLQSDHPLAIEVVKGLNALMEKSLLRQQAGDEGEEPRLTMLETVRQYAAEQLAASGEASVVRDRHAGYYVRLAEKIAGDPEDQYTHVWFDLVRRDQDNFRVAIGWLLDPRYSNPSSDALRLLRALDRFWDRGARPGEYMKWLEGALARPGAEREHNALRLWALRKCSLLARRNADYPQARLWAERAVALAREEGDDIQTTDTLNLLAQAAMLQGEHNFARSVMEECLASYRELGEGFKVAGTLNNLGELARYQGDYQSAQRYYRESLDLFRARGEPMGVIFAVLNLGHATQQLGNLEEARSAYLEAIALAQESEVPMIAAEALVGLCGVIRANLALSLEAADVDKSRVPPRGDAHEQIAQVARLSGLAAALLERSGKHLEPLDQAALESNTDFARAWLGDEALRIEWEQGRNMSLDDALELATGASTHEGGGARPQGAPHARGQHRRAIPGGLTLREYEVVGLVTQGLSNKEIAGKLVLSERTVEMHVSNALHKLGLTARTQLATWAVQHGISSGTT